MDNKDILVLVIIGIVVLAVLLWSLRRKSATIRRLFGMIPLPPSSGGRRGKKKKKKTP